MLSVNSIMGYRWRSESFLLTVMLLTVKMSKCGTCFLTNTNLCTRTTCTVVVLLVHINIKVKQYTSRNCHLDLIY